MKKGLVVLLIALLASAGVALVATGCGTSPEQAKAQLKTDLNGLKASLKAFTNPAAYATPDALQKSLGNVDTAYKKAVASAKNLKSVDISTLKSAYSDFSSSIKNFNASNVQKSTTAIADATQKLMTAWQEVYNSL
jgi:hypothetical protein